MMALTTAVERQFVATGFVVDGDRTLLLFHRKLQMWLPPGGHIDEGETPDAAVIREVKEETGLKVLPVRLVGIYFWPMPPQGLLIFVFRCLQRSGQLTTSTESPLEIA